MSYVNQKLVKKADAMGRFIKLSIGESFEGLYLGYEEKYSEKYKKDTFQFNFEIEGQEKGLSSSSQKVVYKMAYIKPGTAVRVKKIAEGNQTDYDIEELAGKKKKVKSLVSKKKKKKKKTLSL